MAISGEENNSSGSSSAWTWEQNKAFEIGLAIYPEDCADRWEKIAAQIPGNKTLEEIKHHYQLLVDDLNLIESGVIPLPNYDTKPYSQTRKENDKDSEWETRKGQPWTEEEHKQFLLGMDKYGKGDWKSIAKEFVKTRTPTQVASHAQKHFKRQAKKKKGAKRWSIFDITNPNGDQGEDGNGKGREGKEQVSDNTHDTEKEEEVGAKEGVNQASHQGLNPLSPPESWCLEDEFDLDLEE
ncbi:hypothetical protein Cgig2_011930 [Carnegiea gigantea]|uniref:Uncharacterized protein n=1 Tax=Carnegiea gigantea TaxID=171969 RepID=A0A9Q1H043_9CARY|nr:hypothetical protein Cgig2_011930 [Carnegiea gigantea]